MDLNSHKITDAQRCKSLHHDVVRGIYVRKVGRGNSTSWKLSEMLSCNSVVYITKEVFHKILENFSKSLIYPFLRNSGVFREDK